MKTILFQGDSITDANRFREEGHDFCSGHGYVTMVQALIGCDDPGKYTFFNRGIGGDKITNIIERRNRDIVHLEPDYMSILVGVNDVWAGITRNDGTSAELYELLYDSLIREVTAALPKLKIAIMEPFILRSPAQEAYYGELQSGIRARAAAAERIARKYRLPFVLESRENESFYPEFRSGVCARAEAAKRIAEKYRLTFLPLQIKFDLAAKKTGDTSHWLRDGVHPTPAGHKLIAEEWYKNFYQRIIKGDLS